MTHLHVFKGNSYLLIMNCEERRGTARSRSEYAWIGGEGKIQDTKKYIIEPFFWETYPVSVNYVDICLDINKYLLEISWDKLRGEPALAKTIDLIAEQFLGQIKKSREEQKDSLFLIPRIIPKPILYKTLFAQGLCYDREGQAHMVFS